MCCVSEDALQKAKNELNEVPEERAVKTEWLRGKIVELQQQDKLPQNCRIDDRMLVRFLRGNKFDTDKSLSQYINYQNFRGKVPGLSVEDLTYDSVKEVLETGVFEIIEGRCTTGCQGIILYPPRWNMQQHKIEQVICAAFYMLEMLYEKHEDVEIHGIRLIEDFTDFSFLQQLRMEANLLTAGKPVMEFIQEVFPMRLKGVHLVNEAWYVSTLIAIIKPFMKQKMRKRITYHRTNYTELNVYFSPNVLPASLGGSQSLAVPLVLQLYRV